MIAEYRRVIVWMKQTGQNSDVAVWTKLKQIHRRGADPAAWPERIRVQQMPMSEGGI